MGMCSDTIDSSAFYDFLWKNNVLEDMKRITQNEFITHI